jgi:hypothetical protein
MNPRSGFFWTALLLFSTCWAQPKFTDDDFHHLLSEHQAGIIYLWSPFMPLSSLGRDEIGPIAEELSVNLTTLLDPYADSCPTADPLMDSQKLMSLGMLDHYPAVALYKNGHLIEDVLVLGYEKPKTLIKLLRSYFERENL